MKILQYRTAGIFPRSDFLFSDLQVGIMSVNQGYLFY